MKRIIQQRIAARRKQKGISLIEVLVYMAIAAGVIATVVVIGADAFIKAEINDKSAKMSSFLSPAGDWVRRSYAANCAGTGSPTDAQIEAQGILGATNALASTAITSSFYADARPASPQNAIDAWNAREQRCQNNMWGGLTRLFDTEGDFVQIVDIPVGFAINQNADNWEAAVAAPGTGTGLVANGDSNCGATATSRLPLGLAVPMSEEEVCLGVAANIAAHPNVNQTACEASNNDLGESVLLVCVGR